MKKGISFYYGYGTNYIERAKKIKNVGFDCVMTNQDKRFINQNSDIASQIEVFKENNLEVSSLHNQYKTIELEHFWKDDEIGKKLENTLVDDILTAKKYHFKCVVVHMIGVYNKIGEDRIKRILKFREDSNIFLAIENIDYPHPLIDIFDKIQHPFLKFCYDSGHNNCFDPEFDYLSKYGDKLVCLHLHDNNGKQDEHTLNRFGTINWQKLAQKLSKLNLDNISLDYELLMYSGEKIPENECLTEAFNQAVELEKLIENYKLKTKTSYKS